MLYHYKMNAKQNVNKKKKNYWKKLPCSRFQIVNRRTVADLAHMLPCLVDSQTSLTKIIITEKVWYSPLKVFKLSDKKW